MQCLEEGSLLSKLASDAVKKPEEPCTVKVEETVAHSEEIKQVYQEEEKKCEAQGGDAHFVAYTVGPSGALIELDGQSSGKRGKVIKAQVEGGLLVDVV